MSLIIPPMPDPEAANSVPVDPAAIPDWELKLREIAKDTMEAERPPGQFFSTKSGVLSFNKIPLANNEMNVIVTAQIFENTLYTEKFNAEKVSAPTCYAFGIGGEAGMKPHPLAYKPQNVDCHTCPNNKWGSDPGGGKGKACKNLRRLCVIPAGNATDAGKVLAATAGFIRIPVTSTKNWSEYVRKLAQQGKTPLTVVTNIKLVPDAKTMHSFLFSFVNDLPDRAIMEALVKRNEFDMMDIIAPYPAKDEGMSAPAAQQQAVPTDPAPASAAKFG